MYYSVQAVCVSVCVCVGLCMMCPTFTCIGMEVIFYVFLCVAFSGCSAGVSGSNIKDRNLFLIVCAHHRQLCQTHIHTTLYFISEVGKHLSWLKAEKKDAISHPTETHTHTHTPLRSPQL